MNTFVQNDLKAEIVKTVNPKIGVIALSTDFTIEQDYRSICNQIPVDIFVNRIPFENPLNRENYLKMANHISQETLNYQNPIRMLSNLQASLCNTYLYNHIHFFETQSCACILCKSFLPKELSA